MADNTILQMPADLTNLFKVETKTEQLRSFLQQLTTKVNTMSSRISDLEDKLKASTNDNTATN